MTRHGKNATASSVYSYHEKQKDTEQSSYGTQAARLGKDSVKDFDACCLTLQPCRNPVVTPHGYLYEKEAILEYIVHKKRLLAKQSKLYDKQRKQEEKEMKELAQAEHRSKVEKFMKHEKSIVSKSNEAFKTKTEEKTVEIKPSTSQVFDKYDKNVPSFWIPALTPQAKEAKIKKPDSKVYCPMSNKPIKMKDLIPVKFTPIADRDKKTSMISKKDRWMCAVTHDTLGNSVPSAVLRSTGDVVTLECVDKIIRKNGMRHPVTDEVMSENDIIPLTRGGTGFASTNEVLDSKSYRPVIMA
ncbi:nitric oxide synthase-interacting protein [Ciona intestinalis]